MIRLQGRETVQRQGVDRFPREEAILVRRAEDGDIPAGHALDAVVLIEAKQPERNHERPFQAMVGIPTGTLGLFLPRFDRWVRRVSRERYAVRALLLVAGHIDARLPPEEMHHGRTAEEVAVLQRLAALIYHELRPRQEAWIRQCASNMNGIDREGRFQEECRRGLELLSSGELDLKGFWCRLAYAHCRLISEWRSEKSKARRFARHQFEVAIEQGQDDLSQPIVPDVEHVLVVEETKESRARMRSWVPESIQGLQQARKPWVREGALYLEVCRATDQEPTPGDFAKFRGVHASNGSRQLAELLDRLKSELKKRERAYLKGA